MHLFGSAAAFPVAPLDVFLSTALNGGETAAWRFETLAGDRLF